MNPQQQPDFPDTATGLAKSRQIPNSMSVLQPEGKGSAQAAFGDDCPHATGIPNAGLSRRSAGSSLDATGKGQSSVANALQSENCNSAGSTAAVEERLPSTSYATGSERQSALANAMHSGIHSSAASAAAGGRPSLCATEVYGQASEPACHGPPAVLSSHVSLTHGDTVDDHAAAGNDMIKLAAASAAAVTETGTSGHVRCDPDNPRTGAAGSSQSQLVDEDAAVPEWEDEEEDVGVGLSGLLDASSLEVWQNADMRANAMSCQHWAYQI